jgi:hypothetical protein
MVRGKHNNLHIWQKGDIQKLAQAIGGQKGKKYSNDPAKGGQHHRFRKELKQDLTFKEPAAFKSPVTDDEKIIGASRKGSGPVSVSYHCGGTTGATALRGAISLRIASTSCKVKLGAAAVWPGPRCCPGESISTLVPMLAIWAVTRAVLPLPTVTKVITAPTPMMIPNRTHHIAANIPQGQENGIKEHVFILFQLFLLQLIIRIQVF